MKGSALPVLMACLAVAPAARAQPGDVCAPGDNYCIELSPSARVYGASGFVRLIRPASTPFTVDVDRDGRHRYDTEFVLSGLPDPSELGPYTAYVAWVVDPLLTGLARLGPVQDGRVRTGRIARNKYMVWVSAEADSSVTEREGPLVLRGLSASTRMEAHGFMGLAAFAPERTPDAPGWTAPPMAEGVRMMPGMHRLRPTVRPYQTGDAAAPPAKPRQEVRLADGDTLRLEMAPVSRVIGGRRVAGYGFNGQIPGPMLRVDRGTEIVVEVVNKLPDHTAVHWHGLRLENAFDGVPGLTQDPIPPGGTFLYRLRFPDAGLYWYHPHHREDIWQELGLFGNIHVDAEWLDPVQFQETLMLDDYLERVPFGEQAPTHALMGRFGNVLLTNDEPRWNIQAVANSRLRLYLTNVANTRTFNWSIDGHALEVVATDVGPFAEAVWTESVVIAPAERYVVDVEVSAPGRYAITNRVQSIDHGNGRFFSTVDTLGFLEVSPGSRAISHRTGPLVDVALPPVLDSTALAALPLYELQLQLRTDGLPALSRQMMILDQSYFNPVEWSGTMPFMNWTSSGQEVEWILRDPHRPSENMDIDWRFGLGELVRVRIFNDPDSPHAMQHPIHIHGQRFVVLSVNREPNRHPAWKDTVLVPVGAEVEVLLELSNPGSWMIHCHIAEHLSAGMQMVFEVDP